MNGLDNATPLMVTLDFSDEAEVDINLPAPVTVTGEAPSPVEIATDVTVEMFEMDFMITGDIHTGPSVWEVTNTGEQPDFLLLSRYPELFTETDAMALLESEFAPPASPEAGATPEASPEAGLDIALFEAYTCSHCSCSSGR